MKGVIDDLSGRRFGRLIAVEFHRKKVSGGTKILWDCQCDCGNSRFVNSGDLKNGKQVSCGCFKNEQARNRIREQSTTHGRSKTRLYRIWAMMWSRCSNPNDSGYQDYGGRGIKVCSEWEEFEAFAADMGEPPSRGHTLDRRDVNSSYKKDNCRWATAMEQANNKRTNRLVTLNGVTKTLTEWVSHFNGSYDRKVYDRVIHRINDWNWDIERALTTPKQRCPHP